MFSLCLRSGLHNGKDFDREYLTGIFNAIKNNEIIMPDEAGMALCLLQCVQGGIGPKAESGRCRLVAVRLLANEWGVLHDIAYKKLLRTNYAGGEAYENYLWAEIVRKSQNPLFGEYVPVCL